MMRIKRLIAICLIAVFVCGTLISCGGNGEIPPVRTPAPSPISEANQKDYTDDAALLESIVAYRRTFFDMAESDAADFTVEAREGGVAILSYTGSANAVRVPASIGGAAVVAVADHAFRGNTTLTSLYLPDSILSFGEGILADCQSLTSLRTPLLGAAVGQTQYLGYLFGAAGYVDNVIHVPASLKYLELGGGMERLDDYALFESIHLVCLTLPDSMTHVGSYSMYRCSDLVAVNLSGVRSVADHALSACDTLTLIEFGKDVTSIGLGALEGCLNLRRLILPFVGETDTQNNYLGYLFGAEVPDFSKGYYPSYLVEIEVLDGCTAIGDYAFYECTSLTRLTLPEGIESIGVRAFSSCERLEGLVLPATLSSVRESAFYACRSLRTLAFAEGSTLSSLGINAFYGCDALTEIQLPASLTALPASCFADCRALASIDLGGVLQVGKNAFRNCAALTEVKTNGPIKTEKGNEALESCISR